MNPPAAINPITPSPAMIPTLRSETLIPSTLAARK
jgi:hypothetical protein